MTWPGTITLKAEMGRNEVEWTDEIDGSSNEKVYAGPKGSWVSADHALYDGIASHLLGKMYPTTSEPQGLMSVDSSVISLVPLLEELASRVCCQSVFALNTRL